MNRREALRLLPVPFLSMLPQSNLLKPFKVDIPQETVNRSLERVRKSRLPDRLDAPDWRYGANWSYMKSLVEYWANRFDWKKAQANLNRYPQFLAHVGDFEVHFYYVKGE